MVVIVRHSQRRGSRALMRVEVKGNRRVGAAVAVVVEVGVQASVVP